MAFERLFRLVATGRSGARPAGRSVNCARTFALSLSASNSPPAPLTRSAPLNPVSWSATCFGAAVIVLSLLATNLILSGCVMSEEMKRIESTEKAQKQRAEANSTDLTGEQVFVRSCNTCHPLGKAGLGPSLENLPGKFPEDAALTAFLRKGKGMMPAQTKDVLNDQEMSNLVVYLRQLTAPEESK
jgi:cytochrome c2